MSYILEALKKAQAERQLGAAPTIHATPLHVVADTGLPRRTVLALALPALALAGAVAALLLWRQPEGAAPAGQAPQGAPAPATAAVIVAPQRAPEPAPLRPAPLAPAPAIVAKAPAPASDDALPTQRDLPTVPQLSVGGYIYSRDPADRLLVVDKVLRHEGEEVAPGLVLEKLLPKAAVMNYKGTRYRIPY
ncbi:MAG: general secretion pathway protein GspB [Pseudomonadota bacterium]